MKNRRSNLALSILAGGLSFVGAANATDLILNGSFEIPHGDPNVGWNGFFKTYTYSQNYYSGPAVPSGESPGTTWAWDSAAFDGAWDHFTTPENEYNFLVNEMYAYALNQTVALSNAVSWSSIDAGYGKYTFSAWLASYGNGSGAPDPEQPFVVLRFFDDTATLNTATNGVQIGNDGIAIDGSPAPDANTTSVIFDRVSPTHAVQYADGTTTFPSDLSTDHNWIKYVATGQVPAGARKARIYLTRSPNAGKDASPDTYVDLVKLDVVNTNQSSPGISVPPASLTAAVGNSARFSVVANGPDLSYQWRHSQTNLPGQSGTALSLPLVQFADAGSYDVVVTNTHGSITSTPPAVLTVINPAVFVTGQWDFLQGDLKATVGTDLQYGDPTVQPNTDFGTTTSYGLPDINGAPAAIMHFTPPPAPNAFWGYKLFPHTGANGGGTNINQYTLIYDIYYPFDSDGIYRSFWQIDTNNETDGELFVNPGDGIGISQIYDGFVSPTNWHRIAFAFDMSGPGEAPVLAKFIDGVKVGNQTSLDGGGLDGRFTVGEYGLLFADNDGDVAEAFVSSVQFSNGRRPDAFIEALGGPSALKIPGAIWPTAAAGSVTIHWTGGVALQSADSLAGPWTTVGGTAGQSSYTPPSLGTQKFYRPQIP